MQEASKTYEEKLVEEWLNPEKTALLLVDFQEEFTHPESPSGRWFAERRGIDLGPLPEFDPAGPSRPGDPDQDEIPAVRRLVEFCRSIDIPVVWARTILNEATDARYWKAQGLRMCVEGEWPTRFSAGLEPAPGETIINKTRHSPFFKTDLGKILAERGIETLMVVGRATGGCVEGACRDAMANDFGVVLVADGCGPPGPRNEPAVEKIGLLFGFARTSDELMKILSENQSRVASRT